MRLAVPAFGAAIAAAVHSGISVSITVFPSGGPAVPSRLPATPESRFSGRRER